jgi:large subunit ribosomal protein L6
MSRVAKNPVAIPAKVEVVVNPNSISVSGPLGKLSQSLSSEITVTREGEQLLVSANTETQHARAMSGTTRALLANMVQGVSAGFTKKLSLIGVGYKANAQGAMLNLELGYSHPINHKMPEGVTVQTPSPTEVVLTGANKQVVGQVAAQIRAYRAPEPYKGKGVRYSDEVVAIKETKKK